MEAVIWHGSMMWAVHSASTVCSVGTFRVVSVCCIGACHCLPVLHASRRHASRMGSCLSGSFILSLIPLLMFGYTCWPAVVPVVAGTPLLYVPIALGTGGGHAGNFLAGCLRADGRSVPFSHRTACYSSSNCVLLVISLFQLVVGRVFFLASIALAAVGAAEM